MNFDLILCIIAGILLAVGFLGTFIPIIPGAPLAWAGLLVAFFSSYTEISLSCLIITAVFAVLISILDNILPVYLTKKTGGSKSATTGSTIGLIVGFFAGPPGIIFGPFIGAFIGEIIHTKGNFNIALKSGFGAFLGFIFGTGLKMITVGIFIWIFVKAL